MNESCDLAHKVKKILTKPVQIALQHLAGQWSSHGLQKALFGIVLDGSPIFQQIALILDTDT